MTDKLKDFVKEHREEMDVHEPSANVWNALNAQLIKKSFLNGLLQSVSGKIIFAASSILIATAVYTFSINNDDQENQDLDTTDPGQNISGNKRSTPVTSQYQPYIDKDNDKVNGNNFSGIDPQSNSGDRVQSPLFQYYNLDRMSGQIEANNFYNGAKTSVNQHSPAANNAAASKFISSAVITNLKCNGDRSGHIDITPNGNRESFSFVWSHGNKTTEDIRGLDAGTYTLSVTDPHGAVGVFNYTVIEPSALSLSASSDHARCGLQNGVASVAVNKGGTGPYSYLWNNGESTAAISNLKGGIYNVTVTDNAACTSITSANIENIAGVTSAFSASLLNGEAPLKVDFTSSSVGATQYMWKFGDGEAEHSLNPSHVYTKDGTYHACLIVHNQAGCVDSSCSNIMVNSAVSVMTPNVFTPNGDNKNDNFIIATKGIEKVEMVIFDQFGVKVWEISGPLAAWDGITIAGKQAVEGNYIYDIKTYGADNKMYEYKGIVKLVR